MMHTSQNYYKNRDDFSELNDIDERIQRESDLYVCGEKLQAEYDKLRDLNSDEQDEFFIHLSEYDKKALKYHYSCIHPEREASENNGDMNMNMFEIIARFMRQEPDLVALMNRIDHNFSNEIVSPFHVEGSIWTHTMCVCTIAQLNDVPIEVKFAALLHDVGKAYTREEKRKDDGHVRVSFTGHDGESFYRVVDILKGFKDVLTTNQRTTIEKLVAMHSTLYSWTGGGDEKIAAQFRGDTGFLKLLGQLANCDAAGRIADRPSDKNAFLNVADAYYNSHEVTRSRNRETEPLLTLLVGPPCVGKSTWLEIADNTGAITKETVIISRDALVIEAGAKYLEEGFTYTEAWNVVDQKEVDKELDVRFNAALSAGHDIIVDMTNVVRKRRRRFVNMARHKDYVTQAIVFHVGRDVQEARNVVREGKTIPEYAMKNMRTGFLYPTYDDFDFIQTVREEGDA